MVTRPLITRWKSHIMMGIVAPVANAEKNGRSTRIVREINAHLTGDRADDHQDDIPAISIFVLESGNQRMKFESSVSNTYDFE